MQRKCKEIFGFARASPRDATGAQSAESERTLQSRVGTRSARAKWVRAKVIHPPQIENSFSERTEVSLAEGAVALMSCVSFLVKRYDAKQPNNRAKHHYS